MNHLLVSSLAASLLLSAACQRAPDTAAAAPAAVASPTARAAGAPDLVARGEYLVRTTGCNDCHTAGYAQAQGNIDPAQWLTGSPMGFKGPWGTTYATNLRLRLADMDEAQWLDYSATLRTRPLMPDFALRAMSPDDRRAIYRFIKSLGPGGEPAPAYLPPDRKPPAPYYELVLPAAPIAQR
ncbi:c-type cytochrome [Lysobacter koreensis]|uniref:C-type cytochrome n=1 Tax=Lysobacter koreensis TaxID=266122 RepID=A0ABW2YNG1_9GAMM